MKKFALLLFLTIPLLGVRRLLFAQSVTISPSGTGAIIEANSTTKGIMPPKITMTQRANLTPTAGMQVYCTDCTPSGPYSFDGTNWIKMFDYQTTSGPCATYTVGQQAQGGTVIWVDDSRQHGLVAAPVDYSRQATSPLGNYTLDYFPWGVGINATNTTFAMAQRIGTYGGQENTDKIIKQFGWAEYGAFLWTLRNWSGYGDWYLPSIDELVILYNNRNLLPTPLKTSSSNQSYPSSDYYWSSTETNATTAYALFASSYLQPTSVGQFGNIPKWIDQNTVATPFQERYVVHVRAVRRF